MPKRTSCESMGQGGGSQSRKDTGPMTKGSMMNLGNKGNLVSADGKGEMEGLAGFKPNRPCDVFSTNLTKGGT